MQLMRNGIVIEALWHPQVKKYRTFIRLNHISKLHIFKLIINNLRSVI